MASFLNSLRTKFGLGKHHPRLWRPRNTEIHRARSAGDRRVHRSGQLGFDLAAGADYGYALLWMVTLSTVMLIVLQHNVAHLGIATGLCLSEAAHRLPEAGRVAHRAGVGRARVDLHVAGRNSGRGDRVADAVRHSGADRGADGADFRNRHAVYQQLPADREVDHRVRGRSSGCRLFTNCR